MHKKEKKYENYFNRVMLVFIGKLSVVLSDEYPFAMVSVISQLFVIFSC